MTELDVAIVASRMDPAGMNIAEQLQLLETFPATIGSKKTGLFLKDKFITDLDNIDREIPADIFVFASQHKSKAAIHSLSVHSIGSFGKAVGSGRDNYLVPAPALLMRDCLKLLNEKVEKENMDYEVILEATHHGPVLEKPSMFIEIGSDEAHYRDEKAGRIVAATILDAIRKIENSCEVKTFVGIGGMHHCPNFTKVMLNDAISYVCPKYLLESLDEGMLKQSMKKSVPVSKGVVLDWKGMGREKERLKQLLSGMGIEAKRTSDYVEGVLR